MEHHEICDGEENHQFSKKSYFIQNNEIILKMIIESQMNCFHQGHSSHHALITLVSKITQSLDLRDMVIGKLTQKITNVWLKNYTHMELEAS